MTTLADRIAQAIRKEDGDHTAGAGRLGEIAATEVARWLRDNQYDSGDEDDQRIRALADEIESGPSDPVAAYDRERVSEETAKVLDEMDHRLSMSPRSESPGYLRAYAHEHGWHLSSCEGGFRAVEEGFTTLSHSLAREVAGQAQGRTQ